MDMNNAEKCAAKMTTPASLSLLQSVALRQFIKFCIVGASSALINLSIFSLLLYGLHLQEALHSALANHPQWQQIVTEYQLWVQLAALAAFLLAATNGFFWNSRWTFRHNDPSRRRSQYFKFVSVNVVGLILHQIILFLINRALIAGNAMNEKGWAPLIAFVMAAFIVVFWNFFANKLWTFNTES